MRDSTRSAELTALTEIAAQVNCTQDLNEILSGALATTLQVVGVDAGEEFLFDEETGELFLHAQQGLSEAFLVEEAVLGPGECLCGLSAASRSLVVAADIASHPARSRSACSREGFRSLLCLPLLVRGQVLGLLNVQCRAPRQFTAEDEELLTAIGNQIGIAIANAQLIDDDSQVTLVSASTLSEKLGDDVKNNSNAAAAAQIGEALARKALDIGIRQARFDRNGCKYHGRVKALAEAAREAGLRF